MKSIALAALVFLACSCSDQSRGVAPADSGGTLVITTISDPGSLFPPFVMTPQAKQITEQIYDYLADVGPELDTRDERKFRPALADRWRWSSDSLMLAFHINPNCGMLLERGESDYFLGAYTVNLIAVEILLAAAFLIVMLVTWPDPPWDALEYGGIVLSIIGAVLCYPFAKTTWLAVDLMFRPPHREDFITRVK
jgi:hypothetical protein